MERLILESPIDPQVFIKLYKDGNVHGWDTEFKYLWSNHTAKLLGLMALILKHGIQDPVEVGPDHRVWDGHHRIAVAVALNIPIPFVYVNHNAYILDFPHHSKE